ncbi:hypothetical protein [Stenotrophomonas sp. SrG]
MVISERGIQRSYRHMHVFVSHSFCMLNTEG